MQKIQTCRHCENPNSVISPDNCCSGCSILEQRDLKVMKWISVKDKVPKLDEEVLVYVHGISHNSGPYQIISLSYLTQFFGKDMKPEGIEWICKMSCDETVTHWMPLPEPPKE